MKQEQHFIDYIEQSIIQNWDKDALTKFKITLIKHYFCADLNQMCKN